jgi:hypothetical protein
MKSKFVQLTKGAEGFHGIAFDGRRVFVWVTKGKSRFVRIHAWPSLEKLADVKHDGATRGVVSRDGALLAFPSGRNEKAQRWYGERAVTADASTGELVATTALPKSPPQSVALSPDNRLLAVGEYECFRIHDPQTGKELRHVTKAHDRVIDALAWSPDGSQLATRSIGDTALWDTKTWKRIAVLPTAENERCSIDFLASGALVALIDETHLGVWLNGKWKHRAELRHPAELVVVARGANVVITAGRDHGVRKWSASLEPIAELEKHGDEKISLSVSDDASVVLVAIEDGMLVWAERGKAPAVDPRKPPDIEARIASPRQVKLASVADLEKLVAKTKWFASVGKPIAGVKRLAKLEEWNGAEQPRLGTVFTLGVSLYETAERVAPAGVKAKAEKLSGVARKAAMTALRTRADGDVAQDPKTAAVYGATMAVQAAAAWIGLGWPLPTDLQTLLAWFADGRWPCGVATPPRDGRKTPILVV